MQHIYIICSYVGEECAEGRWDQVHACARITMADEIGDMARAMDGLLGSSGGIRRSITTYAESEILYTNAPKTKK